MDDEKINLCSNIWHNLDGTTISTIKVKLTTLKNFNCPPPLKKGRSKLKYLIKDMINSLCNKKSKKVLSVKKTPQTTTKINT